MIPIDSIFLSKIERLKLSSEFVSPESVLFVENGIRSVIYVGSNCPLNLLNNFFGVSDFNSSKLNTENVLSN